MSGGSFDYMYHQIRNEYSGEMEDLEMEELLKDFCGVLHDLEWYRSGDYGEEDYRKSVNEFKRKWLHQNADQRLKNVRDYAIGQIGKLTEEIRELLK